MKTACTVLALAVTLLVANAAGAADKKKDSGDDASVPYFKTIDKNLKPVTLTDEQKSKLEDLKKEYEPKLKEAYAKEDVLTPEQKKASDEAREAATAAGKKRKEVNAAGDAAVKLTAEQKKQKKEAHKQILALEKELREKYMDLLTPEQKAQIDAAKSKKKDRPAKKEAAMNAETK